MTVLDDRTVKAINSPKRDKQIDTILVNMERWRWLPRQLGAQRLTLDQWHRVPHEVLNVPCVQERNDVRVLQRGRELDLAAEPLRVHPRGHLRGQHLHDDFAGELHVLDHEDAAHPTTAQLPLDTVGVAESALEASEEISHSLTQGRGTTPS